MEFFVSSILGFIYFGISMIVLKYVIKSAIIEANQEINNKGK